MFTEHTVIYSGRRLMKLKLLVIKRNQAVSNIVRLIWKLTVSFLDGTKKCAPDLTMTQGETNDLQPVIL